MKKGKKMRKSLFLLILPLLCCAIIWKCAGSGPGSSKVITVPANDTNYLVCGSVIIENNWYSSSGEDGQAMIEGRQVQEVYKKGVEVAILARYRDETGKEELKGYYVEADVNGYFFIENVPAGDYSVKGFRISLNDGRYITVYSDLDGAESAFLMRRKTEQMIVFKGNYFPFPAVNRIVNLRHNVFFMSNTLMVGSQTYVVVRNQSFNFPDIKHNMEPVEQYFIDKFPDNGWTMFLQASMQQNLESGY